MHSGQGGCFCIHAPDLLTDLSHCHTGFPTWLSQLCFSRSIDYNDHVCVVQMAGGVLDGGAQERLPSSSTCINLLKMPPYKSTELLRSKLLFAIRNVAGFDLS